MFPQFLPYKGIHARDMSESDYENFLKEQEQVSSTEVKIKTQAEFDKAYASLAPGESMTVKGKTYTKPNK